jgi:hypothetical protein
MVYRQRIAEPGAWTPADLEADRSWEMALCQGEVADLLDAAKRVREAGLPLERIGQADFPLPRCEGRIRRIRQELKEGRGFALLNGFPVEGRDLADVERMYWGFCAHLGMGLTQNSDATLIHYVTEGKLRPSQGTRGVGNPGKVSMHVDLADCVSLLSIRQPEDSPPSRLTSSLAVHNALLERDPALLERLYEGFVWDRQNEHGPGEAPTTGYRVPVFSERNGVVSCRYNRSWMTKAAERTGGFSEFERALLDAFDAVAEANAFEFPFEPGAVQFANNYTILHGRAPHAPARSEEKTRLLMRIWFNIDGIRDWADEAIVRRGIISHGRLGWTAAELAEGLEGRVRARRAVDGAPLAA